MFVLLLLAACANDPSAVDSVPECTPLTGLAVDDSPEALPLANILVYAESAASPGTPLSTYSDGEGAFSMELSEGTWEIWGEESEGCPGQRLSVDVQCSNEALELVVQLCG
jgi:hypothetical protein